jgi:branched-chain amino acid transport system ATP-binding protein
MILAIKDIGISFGALKAIDGVSFSVNEGQILSVIGPNGAGKTTLFNVISGIYVASQGSVELYGEDVASLAPDALAARGMSRTFQNLQIFQRMTVAQNVMVGRHLKERRNLFADLLRLPSVSRQNRETRAVSLQLLDEVGLRDKADVLAGDLSYGGCKRLEIARALATEPRVLLLDEPAAGCNAVETEEIDRLICRIAQKGIAVVLVAGRLLCEGEPAAIAADERVRAVYLGEDAHG